MSKFPICKAWADEMRQFFPDLKPTYASENGHEWGKRLPEGVQPVINVEVKHGKASAGKSRRGQVRVRKAR